MKKRKGINEYDIEVLLEMVRARRAEKAAQQGNNPFRHPQKPTDGDKKKKKRVKSRPLTLRELREAAKRFKKENE
jgi:hypothetical protein